VENEMKASLLQVILFMANTENTDFEGQISREHEFGVNLDGLSLLP